jgi:hypothetical protein
MLLIIFYNYRIVIIFDNFGFIIFDNFGRFILFYYFRIVIIFYNFRRVIIFYNYGRFIIFHNFRRVIFLNDFKFSLSLPKLRSSKLFKIFWHLFFYKKFFLLNYFNNSRMLSLEIIKFRVFDKKLITLTLRFLTNYFKFIKSNL